VGERLFLETRFAQAFKAFADNGGDVNDPNANDVIVETVETLGAPIDPGPFKGLSINCRACHLVDDALSSPGGSMRTYADFARRSPIPARADGKSHAPRNSPPLVNSTLDRPDGILLHFDAEFSSIEELIAATFTGRGTLAGFLAKRHRRSHTSQKSFEKTMAPLILLRQGSPIAFCLPARTRTFLKSCDSRPNSVRLLDREPTRKSSTPSFE
jgi:hypothetical protein